MLRYRQITRSKKFEHPECNIVISAESRNTNSLFELVNEDFKKHCQLGILVKNAR